LWVYFANKSTKLHAVVTSSRLTSK